MSARVTRAQSVDPSANAVFQTGPLAWTPSLSVPSLGIDSNVFNESENPRRDFTVNVQPAVDAWLRLGPVRIDARQQANAIYFERFESERALNVSSRVGAKLELLWATAHASTGFSRRKERVDARIDTRAMSRSHPATAGIDFRLSGRTRLDIEATVNRIAFDNQSSFAGQSISRALDRSSRTYQGVLSYAATPLTALTLGVARGEERFQFAASQDSTSLRVVPGVTFSANSMVTGTAGVGWMAFTPRSPSARQFSTVVSSVDVGYVLLGLTQFSVGVSRDVMPSIGIVPTYVLQTGVTGTVTHRVSERLDVNVGASHLTLDFGQARPGGEAGLPADRPDTVRTLSAGLGLHLPTGLRIGLRAESVRRMSVIRAGQYSNLRLMSSIGYSRQ